MTFPSRLSLAWQAQRELGLRPVLFYALYQLNLRTGYYRRQLAHDIKSNDLTSIKLNFQPVLNIPEREVIAGVLRSSGVESCLAEANEILEGRVRLFGRAPVDINLTPPTPLADWTDYELKKTAYPGVGDPSNPGSNDIKFTWEPARFGWAYTLGRAYLLSGDERYPACFWRLTEKFLHANPPFQGPNWISAQEAGLRILAFSFSLQIFATSVHTTPERNRLLGWAIAAHAVRIHPTLFYARAQNNNHLLSEAAGLYTAGAVLPQHPQAAKWRELGWSWFNTGIQTQIDSDGAYNQHSTNYQRLMLQLGLWIYALARYQSQVFPQKTTDNLANATRWLVALVDPSTGQLPNLGPNDGAMIQPLSICPFSDYRPALQAAGRAFLNQAVFPPGVWDESSHWLNLINPDETQRQIFHSAGGTPHVLHSPDGCSKAYLRCAHFSSRPGHADQLHLDLWWRGLNIARDAGTYLYNAPPPWDNALAHSAVHNTITVNSNEQMQRVSRFLYLHWAQAYQTSWIDSKADTNCQESPRTQIVCAGHNGYQQFGIQHHRCVACSDQNQWLVEDSLLPDNIDKKHHQKIYNVRLHWLLPDWPWEIDSNQLRLHSPYGWLRIEITPGPSVINDSLQTTLDRAGQRLVGAGDSHPAWGWYSPTYGEKQPALAYSLQASTETGLVFVTRWSFPVESGHA